MAKRQRREAAKPVHGRCHSIAIVSGKGGSGKTMIAVALAQGLSLSGAKVLLVDADFGTGGLTYYLTFKAFSASRIGLADAMTGRALPLELISEAAQSIEGDVQQMENVRLIPIGDQRKVSRPQDLTEANIISKVLVAASGEFDYAVIDCRGGIDQESLDVCSFCDDILMVVETDATAIRASQHLVDTLSDKGMRSKLVGFVLNKVMDDPTTLARSGSSFFSSKYLGAIPFDIDATRCYIQGSIPLNSSLFSRHVFALLGRSPFDVSQFTKVETLRNADFGTVSLRNPESQLGGLTISLMAIYISGIYTYLLFIERGQDHSPRGILDYSFILWLNVLIIAGLSEKIRSSLGRILRTIFMRIGRLG